MNDFVAGSSKHCEQVLDFWLVALLLHVSLDCYEPVKAAVAQQAQYFGGGDNLAQRAIFQDLVRMHGYNSYVCTVSLHTQSLNDNGQSHSLPSDAKSRI